MWHGFPKRVWRFVVGCLCVFAGTQRLFGQEPFALRPNDRVVFYGDSITEQHLYTWWIENYVMTRFPSLHARFWTAGVGGDRVDGGGGGPVDERLQRDVFRRKPTVVTIMLGMNDGHYTRLTPAIESAYARGYEHILQSIREHAPEARILCIGPSPYDDVTRPPTSNAGRYNDTLVRFAAIDARLAKQYGAAYADANAPFGAALQRGREEDLLATTMLVPDRVHPELPAHLLIAAAVLRAWHAPALVSETVIDATTDSATGSQGAVVSAVSHGTAGLQWTSLESALPLPLGRDNAALAFAERISGFEKEFDQEVLRIRRLAPASYQLRVDGADAGIFSPAQLEAGVNLVDSKTPMLTQAQPLEWTSRDKANLDWTRLRITIRKSSPGAEEALDRAEEELQQSLWKDGVPRPHHFELLPVSPAGELSPTDAAGHRPSVR